MSERAPGASLRHELGALGRAFCRPGPNSPGGLEVDHAIFASLPEREGEGKIGEGEESHWQARCGPLRPVRYSSHRGLLS